MQKSHLKQRNKLSNHSAKTTRQQPKRKVATAAKKTTKSSLRTKKPIVSPSITAVAHVNVKTPLRAFSTAKDYPVQRLPNNDVHRFEGKTVIITGGGAGIGRATAIQIAKEHGNLMIVDLNADGVEETKKLCLAVNPESKIEAVAANCADVDQIKSYVQKTIDTFGRIDGLYNNHGIEGPAHLMHEYPVEEIDRVMKINANSFLYNMKFVIDFMVNKQGFGSIVNCSSIAGLRAIPNVSPYVTSKHAVRGATSAAAIEYGEMLNVNSIHPGGIRTEMIERAFTKRAQEYGVSVDKVIAKVAENNPAKRFGTPEEVAYTVAFLLSHQASLVNGANINLDSGQIQRY